MLFCLLIIYTPLFLAGVSWFPRSCLSFTFGSCHMNKVDTILCVLTWLLFHSSNHHWLVHARVGTQFESVTSNPGSFILTKRKEIYAFCWDCQSRVDMSLELLGPVESWAKEKSKQKNTKQEKEREKKTRPDDIVWAPGLFFKWPMISFSFFFCLDQFEFGSFFFFFQFSSDFYLNST